MADASIDPIAQRRRWPLRLARWLFAFSFLGLPVLGMIGLAALWGRSHRVEGSWWVSRHQEEVDLLAGTETHRSVDLCATVPRGLLAVSVGFGGERSPTGKPKGPDAAGGGRKLASVAWSSAASVCNQVRPDFTGAAFSGCMQRATAADAFRLGPGDDARRGEFLDVDLDRALDLPRDDRGSCPLTFGSWESRAENLPWPNGEWRSRLFLVAPIWLWMLPLLGPMAWWLWCPSGRVVPRLSLGRLGIVTAGLALLLALVCRAPATDRAVLALGRLDPAWYYGPDPAGDGSPRIVGLDLSGIDGARRADAWSAAEIGSIRLALGGLPRLRYLSLGSGVGPPSLMTALLPERWPGLEILLLDGSQTDDSTVAWIAAGYPRVERLGLGGTHATDAALAHLRRLDALTHLWLGGLPLTDDGLAHLHGLPALRRVDFEDHGWRDDSAPSALSEPALRRLADSLPAFEELVRPDGSVLTRDACHPAPGAGGRP